MISPSARNKTLTAFAAERRRLKQVSIDDWYTAPTGSTKTNQPHTAAAVDRRDRQTDGRTRTDNTSGVATLRTAIHLLLTYLLDRYINPARYHAGSVYSRMYAQFIR